MTNPLSVLIVAIAASLLSLAFTYVPGLKDWYEKQSGKKALIMVGLMLLVSVVYFLISCVAVLAARLGITVICTVAGALDVALAFVLAVLANQSTYALTKK
jgi:hypothetical protein